MSDEPYILITADTHAGGNHAQYREYLDLAWRDAFDDWRGGYKNPALEHYGRKKLRNWDLEVRAQDQNSQGVVGEVVFPNTVPPFYAKSIVTAHPPRPEHFERALAGIRAHNRWLKDFCDADPVRRAGIGLILPNDLDEAIKDIAFIAEAGLRGGVLLPLIPPDCSWLKPLYDPAWDRVFAAIQDHGLVINQHSGQGSPDYGQGPVPEALWISEVTFYCQAGFRHLLAAGMMFVRTPVQFYAMRFLLGAAEAGFFPGAVFYLMHWYPAAWRGRAISGFYVAFPLSNVVMGSVAGALLALHGRLGLAGWQWLFLVEGLPAILLGAVILRSLPDAPVTAAWLSAGEKAWIASGLAADRAALAREPDPGLRPTLLSPLVIGMGLVNALYLGGNYAFNLYAPTILVQATHLSIAAVGYLIAAGGLLGAAGMLLNSHSSDRRRERHLHLAAPLAVVGAAYGTMSLISSPVAFALAYIVGAVAAAAAAAVFMLVPTDRLTGRSAAGGVAAINGIGMIGSFLAPYGWGLLRDHTGGYATGIRLLPVMFLTAAAIVLWLRASARREEATLLEAVPVDG